MQKLEVQLSEKSNVIKVKAYLLAIAALTFSTHSFTQPHCKCQELYEL